MGGTVSYNVTGWLDKNKDPVNDTVVDVLKRGTCELMKTVWADHPGQSAPPDNEKKKKKKGGGKTVASVYLVQLDKIYKCYSFSTSLLFLLFFIIWRSGLARVVSPNSLHQFTCTSLEDINNGVIDRVLIFVQPSSYIIADSSCPM